MAENPYGNQRSEDAILIYRVKVGHSDDLFFHILTVKCLALQI